MQVGLFVYVCIIIVNVRMRKKFHCRAMEKGRVRAERRSRSPQPRKELMKPISTVEEVSNEPQYIVDREKVRVNVYHSK